MWIEITFTPLRNIQNKQTLVLKDFLISVAKNNSNIRKRYTLNIEGNLSLHRFSLVSSAATWWGSRGTERCHTGCSCCVPSGWSLGLQKWLPSWMKWAGKRRRIWLKGHNKDYINKHHPCASIFSDSKYLALAWKWEKYIFESALKLCVVCLFKKKNDKQSFAYW